MEISLEEIKAVKRYLETRPQSLDDQTAESIAKLVVFQGRYILASKNHENVLGLAPCKGCGRLLDHTCPDTGTQKINGSNKTAAKKDLSYNNTVDSIPLQGENKLASIERARDLIQAGNPSVNIEIDRTPGGKPVLVAVPKAAKLVTMQCHACKTKAYPWQLVVIDDGTVCLDCLDRNRIGGSR